MIIQRVIRHPTIYRSKIMRSDSKEAIEKNIGVVWNKKGMTIDTITNTLIGFVVRVIIHNFFQYRKLNNVPCIVVDLGYKIVNKDHCYDLVELQLLQLSKNLGAIRKTKNAQCKFGSIIVCIFFYV